MPVSRPILIALGAAVLALVAFLATSGMRNGDSSSTPPATRAQTAAPAAAKPDAAKSAPAASPQAQRKDEAAPAQANAGETSKPKPVAADSQSGAPARVQRAVESGRTAVLFFYQRGGADDSATADAVAALRRHKGVSVFRAPVSRLGDFRAVTGRLGISQAPAVVIVGKKGKGGKARVVEGFVDPGTLAQEVADTR